MNEAPLEQPLTAARAFRIVELLRPQLDLGLILHVAGVNQNDQLILPALLPRSNLLHRCQDGRAIESTKRLPSSSAAPAGYQVVQEYVESFLAQVEAQTGAGLPQFVKDEFDAFLECGNLAHGFLRLRCAECAHEQLVAFSCYPQPETMMSSESRVPYLWDSPKDSLRIVSGRKARR